MRRHGYRIFGNDWRMVFLFLAIPFLIVAAFLADLFEEE